MTFSAKLFPIALIALAACDVAPRSIDLERSFIETPEVGYHLFVGNLMAGSVAGGIATRCDRFERDEEAIKFRMEQYNVELARLAGEYPETFSGLMRRFGFSIAADEFTPTAFDDAMASNAGNPGYWVANAGMSVDMAARITGSLIRVVGNACENGDREIAKGTMAGSFLRELN